ncbi:MAG: metallophosphoesterase [Lachnospiraceae bacterium]|nr:metallophosphoesterase [Lachnospiraceae bacterium]
MIYIIIALLLAAFAVFVYVQSSGYNIVEYELSTCKDIGGPVKFVMLSDLHDTDVTHDGNRRLLRSIESINPDFVILAGDMITSYMQPSYNSDVAFDFLRELANRFTVYYGVGNHEQRYKAEPERFAGKYDKLVEFVQKLDIHFLSDSYIDREEDKIRIYGFDIPIDNYRRAVKTYLPDGIINDRLGNPDENKYNILIAHNPDFFDDYAAFGPDLVLSGHLHGGIVAIPGIGGVISPQLRLFPKYDFGTFTKGNTTMIVSRGIGWHTIPVRIFNKAEIVSVTILQDKKGETNGN